MQDKALAERLALVERAASAKEFDGLSWFWMVLFGMLVPFLLLLIGWHYA